MPGFGNLDLPKKLILGFWFTICLLWFLYRGPYRQIFVTHGPDFATIYGATRLWLHHENPYDDAATLAPVRRVAAGASASLGPPPRLPSSVYLPTIFPIIAVFAWLPWAPANLLWNGAPHPGINPAECARLIALGENAYNREKFHLAVAWIRQHPASFVALTSARTVLFWFPWNGSLLLSALNWILVGVSIAGMAMLVRRRHPGVPLFANIWLTFPVVYYFIQASTKYRYPIEWTFILLAAYACYVVLPAPFARILRVPARAPYPI